MVSDELGKMVDRTGNRDGWDCQSAGGNFLNLTMVNVRRCVAQNIGIPGTQTFESMIAISALLFRQRHSSFALHVCYQIVYL